MSRSALCLSLVFLVFVFWPIGTTSINSVSNFEKVIAAPNTSKGKVYDNMKSVEVDSQFLLHEKSNRESKHESISKVPKLIDEKRKHLKNNLSAEFFIYFI